MFGNGSTEDGSQLILRHGVVRTCIGAVLSAMRKGKAAVPRLWIIMPHTMRFGPKAACLELSWVRKRACPVAFGNGAAAAS